MTQTSASSSMSTSGLHRRHWQVMMDLEPQLRVAKHFKDIQEKDADLFFEITPEAFPKTPAPSHKKLHRLYSDIMTDAERMLLHVGAKERFKRSAVEDELELTQQGQQGGQEPPKKKQPKEEMDASKVATLMEAKKSLEAALRNVELALGGGTQTAAAVAELPSLTAPTDDDIEIVGQRSAKKEDRKKKRKGEEEAALADDEALPEKKSRKEKEKEKENKKEKKSLAALLDDEEEDEEDVAYPPKMKLPKSVVTAALLDEETPSRSQKGVRMNELSQSTQKPNATPKESPKQVQRSVLDDDDVLMCKVCQEEGGDLVKCRQCKFFFHEMCGGPHPDAPLHIRLCRQCRLDAGFPSSSEDDIGSVDSETDEETDTDLSGFIIDSEDASDAGEIDMSIYDVDLDSGSESD